MELYDRASFGSNLTLSAAYIGNAIGHLFYRVNYNASVPGSRKFLDNEPSFTAYGYYSPGYNQVLELFRLRRLADQSGETLLEGLSITTAMTWSKAYDFGAHNAFDPFDSDPYRAGRWRAGLDHYDRPCVGLPFGRGKTLLANSNRAVNALVSGWKWSGIQRWMSGIRSLQR